MARVTFLNRADGGYRVTRDPGLRKVARADAGGWSPAPRLDPDIKNYFQDSSIGARRAGGEARFDDLLLRAARGIVQCHSAMRYDLTKRVAYCVDGKFLRGTRRPPRPGPTLIIIYTFIIWPTAPRPGRTDPARTPHAPRLSGPTDRHLSSPGRLVAFNLIKSVTLMSTTITLHETFLQHEHPRHEPNCEHGLRSAAQPVGGPGVGCVHCSLLPT